jgi:hypothetical protein
LYNILVAANKTLKVLSPSTRRSSANAVGAPPSDPFELDPTQVTDPAVMRAKARLGQVLKNKWHLDVLLGVGGMAAV